MTPAIYARYSSHNQDGGTSIEVQLDACRAKAGANAIEYIDRAVTGTTMSRDAFDRMKADAAAGKISFVYVYKFDRFGRSDYAHGIVADLLASGVRDVVSVTEGSDPLVRGIQLVVAADFSRKLSERIRASKLRRFREGAWHGGRVPYGYAARGNRLEVDPDHAAWVRELFVRYLAEPVGFKALAHWLEARGIRPLRARHWSADSVASILRNPMYAGRVEHGCYRTQAQRSRLSRPAADESRHAPELQIIDAKTWQAVQEKMDRRRIGKPQGKAQTRIFTRAVVCGCCGGSVVRRYYKTGRHYRPGSPAYWLCGTRAKVAIKYCDNDAKLDERQAMDRITSAWGELFDPALSGRAIERACERLSQVPDGSRAERERLGSMIADAQQRIEHTVDLLTDPSVSGAATRGRLNEQIESLSRSVEHMQARLAELRAIVVDAEVIAAQVNDALADLRHSIASLSDDAMVNQFLREVAGPMVLTRHGELQPADPSGCESPKPFTTQGIVSLMFWQAYRLAG